MKKVSSTILSAILIMAMLLTLFAVIPLSASAVESSDFEYTILSDGTAEITRYIGIDENDLKIPAVLYGRKVTRIGAEAFAQYDALSLTSVTIPDSVIAIGDRAFYQCDTLISVTLGSSVTEIGKEAFYCDTSLESVTIPASVTKIGDHAFGYFRAESAFDNDNDNDNAYARSAGFTVYGDEGSAAQSYAWDNYFRFVHLSFAIVRSGDYQYRVLDDGSAEIVSYRSAGSRIDQLYIPDRLDDRPVTRIGDTAFMGIDRQDIIIIPDSVTSIGKRAFYNCRLTNVFFPAKADMIGEKAFGYYQKYNRRSMKYVEERAACKAIGYKGSTAQTYAKDNGIEFVALTASADDPDRFDYKVLDDGTAEITLCKCTAAKLDIPSEWNGYTVTRIDDNAFQYDSFLTDVSIPDSVTSIGSGAFSGTAWYSAQPDGLVYLGKALLGYKGTEPKTVNVKEGTRIIADNAFFYCRSLAGVTFPDSLKAIGNFAFNSCTSLSGLTIPDSVTHIGAYSFAYCGSLQGVTIGKSIAFIGSGAFLERNKFTIYGYKKTAAETYAAQNGIDFVGSDLPLSAPQITKIQNTVTGVKLTWGAVDGAEKYRVFVKSSKGWTKLSDTAATSYVYKKAKSGTKYTYTVRCISQDGKRFTGGYDSTGWTATYIGTPVLRSTANTTAGVKLIWGKVTGAEKYRVFVKTSKRWTKLGDTAATSYVYKKAKSGTKYTFTVRCISKDGKTYTSAYDTAGIKAAYIAAPSLPTLKNTKNGVQISWKKVTGAEKYRIFRKTGTGGWKKLADVKSLNYVDKTAKKGKTYTYTVRCISSNGKTYTSAYNAAGKKIKCVR